VREPETTQSGVSNRVSAQRPRGRVGPGAEACLDPEIIGGYLRDASGRVGEAQALFRPESEAELAAVLRRAASRGEALTAVGSQTSTTASSVPCGGWLLSMEKLTRLLEVDSRRRRARAEAGILLGDFQRRVEDEGWLYPPDPTSRHECTLGASVACNASGARSFHYGPTRDWVHRLRVVLATGDVLDLTRGQVISGGEPHFEISHAAGDVTRVPVPVYREPIGAKHAAGYKSGPELDMIDLFIGSEGTLGVMSEVEAKLTLLPASVLSLLAFFPDPESALELVERSRRLRTAKRDVSPRCLEWLDCAALEIIGRRTPEIEVPGGARAAVFIEQECAAETDVGSPSEDELVERWAELLSDCGVLDLEAGGVLVARTAAQAERLHRARHAVPEDINDRAVRNGMPKLGTDLSVPDARLREMLELYRRASRDPRGLLRADEVQALFAELECAPPAGRQADDPAWDRAGLPAELNTVVFGHIGDSHLHVNFLPESAPGLALARAVYAHLTRAAIAAGGSPSAEHGIGKIKHAALRQLVGEGGVAEMRAVKRALDPSGCLGRGNLFPTTSPA
jgi:D-lactate dehydrogenase (cytochrome)